MTSPAHMLAEMQDFRVEEFGDDRRAFRKDADFRTRHVLITAGDETDVIGDVNGPWLVARFRVAYDDDGNVIAEDEEESHVTVEGFGAALQEATNFLADCTPQALAMAFRDVLVEVLTPEELAEADERNAAEEGGPESSLVCHSHDHCDANEVMLAAMKRCDVPVWTTGDDPTMRDDALALMNDAWNRAKVAGFSEATRLAKRAGFTRYNNGTGVTPEEGANVSFRRDGENGLTAFVALNGEGGITGQPSDQWAISVWKGDEEQGGAFGDLDLADALYAAAEAVARKAGA